MLVLWLGQDHRKHAGLHEFTHNVDEQMNHKAQQVPKTVSVSTVVKRGEIRTQVCKAAAFASLDTCNVGWQPPHGGFLRFSVFFVISQNHEGIPSAQV